MKYIIVTITSPNKKVTNTIVKTLLNLKLVSCVNVINKIKSVYWWKDNVCKCNEDLLICKTIKKNFKEIVKEIKNVHPYEVPEIVCFDILNGEQKYLEWINQYTKNAAKK